MSKSHYSTWCAKIGMFWFCNSCRLNFEPAVYDREKTIMKALRELLIRTDSMDTRLGNYVENLRKINNNLSGSHLSSKAGNTSTTSIPTKSFAQRIDELTLDDTYDDPIHRSRSGDDTSFFEVLDEVNGSLALLPDKFVVGSNKRVHIVAKPSSSSSNRNVHRSNVSSPASVNHPYVSTRQTSATDKNTFSPEFAGVKEFRNPSGPRAESRPTSIPLKVANSVQTPSDVESFYVTPFAPDQLADEVKQYVIEISNADPSLVNVTKLVPRGKNVEELSFVSFKVTISKSASSVVGDQWYWPDGITVRAFEPNPKNGAVTRLPTIS